MAKQELTLHAYDRLIEMMRSSNMEDFFMGLELYKNHHRTHVLDVLMAKSFGGTKRVKLIINLKLTDVPMLVTIDMVEPLIKTKNERKIFDRLKDEYNS